MNRRLNTSGSAAFLGTILQFRGTMDIIFEGSSGVKNSPLNAEGNESLCLCS